MCVCVPLYPSSSSSSSSWGIYRFIDGPGTKEEPDPLEGHWWQMRTCATQKPTLLSLPFFKLDCTSLLDSIVHIEMHFLAFYSTWSPLTDAETKKQNKKGNDDVVVVGRELAAPFCSPSFLSCLIFGFSSPFSWHSRTKFNAPCVCVCVYIYHRVKSHTHKKRVKPMG